MELISKSELVKLNFLKNIVTGVYSPGAMVNSIRGLAKEVGVSFSLVNKVYQEMEILGIIQCASGQGYYLLPDADKKGEEYLSKLFSNSVRDIKRIGTCAGYDNDQIINKVNCIIKEINV